MYKINFQDTKCAVNGRPNTIEWNALTTVCNKCWKRYGKHHFCPKCHQYVNYYDANASTCQHINDYRCVKCHLFSKDCLESIVSQIFYV